MINDPQSVSLWQTNIQYVNRCLTLTCLYSYITVIQSKFFKSLFAWFFFSINVQKHPTVAPWHTAGLKSHTGAHHAVMLVTHTHTLTLSLYGDDTGKKKKWRVCSSQLSRCHLQEIFSAPQQRHGSQAQANTHCPFIYFFRIKQQSQSHTEKKARSGSVSSHLCSKSNAGPGP